MRRSIVVASMLITLSLLAPLASAQSVNAWVHIHLVLTRGFGSPVGVPPGLVVTLRTTRSPQYHARFSAADENAAQLTFTNGVLTFRDVPTGVPVRLDVSYTSKLSSAATGSYVATYRFSRPTVTLLQRLNVLSHVGHNNVRAYAEKVAGYMGDLYVTVNTGGLEMKQLCKTTALGISYCR